jgi:hypothetical protein
MMDYLLKNIATLARNKKEVTDADKTVVTLRQALEGSAPMAEPGVVMVDIRSRDIGGQFNVGGPVGLRRQKHSAPARQTRIGNWKVLSIYWQLLKWRKRRVYADHSIGLPAEKWPILKALAADFRKHTQVKRWVHPHWYKYYADDQFVLREIFQQDLEDLPENWDLDHMFVPMWDSNDPSDGTHAIFMLERMNFVMLGEGDENGGDLPSCVVEHYGDDAALAAWERMVETLEAGKLSAFPPPWRKSLAWLKRHSLYSLTSYDLECQGKEIQGPADILDYFWNFKQYAQMQKITGEVYDAFEKDADAEWIRLFGAFIRKPRAKKTKTLVEVFNHG